MYKFEAKLGAGMTLAFIRAISQECARLGGPLSKTLNGFVQKGQLKKLLEHDVQVELMDGSQTNDYLYYRQIQALVSKQGFLDLGYDRKKEAREKFRQAEEKCRVTNERLWSQRPEKDVASVLHTAQRIIAEILGPVPSYADMSFLFGPGASTNVEGRVASFRTKLGAPMQCSESLVTGLGEFLAEFPLWCQTVAAKEVVCEDDITWTVPVEVRPAKLGFVPKTSKTDRTICVEPSLNALGQKGIGSYMKKRLCLYGVDLRDQGKNQRLAELGSMRGSYATIDLSSASDTVSYALVMSLLPWDWFQLLDRFRSECVETEEGLVELEKFSSMGNAYTFELESLIFYALSLAACDFLGLLGQPAFADYRDLLKGSPDVCVYGDDIIVPVAAYSFLSKVLTWCGFELNSKKSYCYGPFRESCGADWFMGFDVRPWYLRDEVSERSLYVAHNFFLRKGERSLAKIVLRFTRKEQRLFGPDGYGDGHLLGTWSFAKSGNSAGYDGGWFRSRKGVQQRYAAGRQTDVLIPSYTAYAEMARENRVDPFVIRGVKRYRTTLIYTTKRGIFRPW